MLVIIQPHLLVAILMGALLANIIFGDLHVVLITKFAQYKVTAKHKCYTVLYVPKNYTLFAS